MNPGDEAKLKPEFTAGVGAVPNWKRPVGCCGTTEGDATVGAPKLKLDAALKVGAGAVAPEGWAPNENGDAEDEEVAAAPKPVGGKVPNGVAPKGVTEDFVAISPNAGVEDVDELKPINGAAVVLVAALAPKDPKLEAVEVAVS